MLSFFSNTNPDKTVPSKFEFVQIVRQAERPGEVAPHVFCDHPQQSRLHAFEVRQHQMLHPGLRSDFACGVGTG
jgi:hypothetical protein